MKTIRNTVQRDMVFSAVCSLGNHPTADAIYRLVIQHYPSISRGTVYRNLNVLAEQGMIAKIHLPDGLDHFDCHTNKHYHMRCTQCGKVFDINLPELEERINQVNSPDGFVLEGHDIVFTGRCPDCNKL